jgi:hypothetical protein
MLGMTGERLFRVFVTSTFSDLVAERNALQEHVFPRLRRLCADHGAQFQAVDLRWGVSEEASLDQQAVTICLEEVARCGAVTPRPNFVLLLHGSPSSRCGTASPHTVRRRVEHGPARPAARRAGHPIPIDELLTEAGGQR